jgi:glyoxylase-like metal-dependent hydrolase (beta-lactamase superfamily II)
VFLTLSHPDYDNNSLIDPDRVLEAIRGEGLRLAGILTTHCHWDHAGGNEEIRHRDPSVKVLPVFSLQNVSRLQ